MINSIHLVDYADQEYPAPKPHMST